jgi:phosphohistidine swiveling domain-containing protein
MVAHMSRHPQVVELTEPAAIDPDLAGAKAANLARANAAGLPTLPGFVLTTAWLPSDRAVLRAAWRDVSNGGRLPVVVRSSSTGEDGGASSMAGVFESVLDVEGETALFEAVETVLGSAAAARTAGLVDAPMAVLVQPMLRPRWGGVLFGADPISGRRDRIVVAAVPNGPAALVSGEVDGWTAVLDRRGRVREDRSAAAAPRPPSDVLRALAGLASRTAEVFGGPQDVEWAVDADLGLVLLQARPITTLAPRRGTVFGPGPVAESFPEALSPLEAELWLDPMRDGLREALRLTGATSSRVLQRSPLLITVDGMAAADLHALGAESGRGMLRRLDPRPPARRLRAAWRVGRLRSAFAQLALDVVGEVDDRLMTVPPLVGLSDAQLLAVLDNGQRTLVSLHGHEALAGLLIPDTSGATVTGASLALEAIATAHANGTPLAELVERDPVVLALVPPRVGPTPMVDGFAGTLAPPAGGASTPDPAAVAREALRLRVRWVQELTARAAWELGRRLADSGVLESQELVRALTLAELAGTVQRRTAPAELALRPLPAGRMLPARFRLSESGAAQAVPTASSRRGRARSGGTDAATGAIGAGGGVGTGPVHIGGHDPAGYDGVAPGSVLVVGHLDPRLATVIPRLGGLVAETGNPLSHLAILAREYGVPVVVGLAGATTRFATAEVVTVDGHTGHVRSAEPSPAASSLVPTTANVTAGALS